MPARSLRDNAFLIAAVSLPVAIVGMFLLITAIPRWTVSPPQYDLLLRTTEYSSANVPVSVELVVRDETLQAMVRVVKDQQASRVRLWRFDHATMSAREVPLDVPAAVFGSEQVQTIVVEALRGQRVVTDTKAPDGYQLRTARDGRPGLIGDIFGMRRYGQPPAIVNRGRVIPIEVSTANRYDEPVFLGWIVDKGR
jgi:hypothetical protein